MSTITKSCTWVGFSGTVSSDVVFSRLGDLIYIFLQNTSGTSNAATLTSPAAFIPEEFRPASTISHIPIWIQDSDTHSVGSLQVTSTGQLLLGKGVAPSGFTTSGTKALTQGSYSYRRSF